MSDISDAAIEPTVEQPAVAVDAPVPDVQLAEAPPVNKYDAAAAEMVEAPAAVSVPPVNKYDAAADSLVSDRNTKVRASVLTSTGTADTAGKAVALSRKTGLPADMVERNLPEVEKTDKLNRYDEILKNAPKMADWLAQDPMNVKVADGEGDVEKLGFLEWTVNELYRPYLQQQASSGLAGMKVAAGKITQLDAAEAKAARGDYLTPFEKAMLPQAEQIRKEMQGFMAQYSTQRLERSAQAAALPELPAVKEMQAAGEAGDWGGVFSALMKDPVRAAYAISLQGAAMLPLQIGGAVVAGPVGVFGVSFGLEYMGAVEEAIKASGVDTQDPAALMKALSNPELMAKVEKQAATKASVIGAFDTASMGVAGKTIGVGRKALTRHATNIVAQIGVQGALGGAGEALGSLAADLPVDPFAVVSEVLGEMGGAPMEVAGVRGWKNAVRQDATAEQWAKFQALPPAEQQATGQAMLLDKLVAQANDTKLAKTSPEKLQEFMASVSGQDATVFVPAEAVNSYMQDMTGLQSEAFLSSLGVTADQIARIRQTDEDFAIPLAMYITGASEAHAAWRDQVRTEVDGFSVRQAQEWAKAKDEQIKALQDKFEEHVAAGLPPDPQTVVYQQVLEMAKANGYTNDVASQHAALYASRYAARAARNPGQYADALDAFEKAGTGKGLQIQTMLADGTRAAGPGVLDTMLDSLRSGKDPVRVPRAARVAKDAGPAADATILKAASRLARGWTPEKAIPAPQSLTDFVRKNGGLRLGTSEAGDLRAADLTKIPGLLQLKGKGKGRQADDMAQAAMDAGFRFGPDTATGSGVDVAAFLKALEGDATGRSKAYPDDADTTAFQEQQDYFNEFFRWLKDDLGWEPKGRTPEEVAKFLAQDDTTQRLMVLAERVEALGPDSDEARHLDRELARIADESLERLADEFADRDAAMAVDDTGAAVDTDGLTTEEWEALHDEIAATVEDDAATDGRPADGQAAGQRAQGAGRDKAGDVAAGKTPKEAAAARREAALGKFQSDRRQLADVLDSLGLDIGKMSNAQVRAVLEKEVAGRKFDQGVPVDLTPGGGSKTITVGDTTIDYGVASDGKSAEVILIKTPAAKRGEGSGRAALEQFLRSTDAAGITVFLTAEPMDKGTSKAKLEAFYKSVGFKANKGKNKDFSSRAGMVRAPSKTYNQPVYHGGPHIFDRFSLDHIGSGEGAQAYGWGLYFAGKKEIAEFYKTSIGRNEDELIKIGERYGLSGDAAVMLAQQFQRKFGGKTFDGWLDSVATAVDDPLLAARSRDAMTQLLEKRVEAADAFADMKAPGRLYHVEIPEDGAYLLWDKPLSEQPEGVKAALEKLGVAAPARPTPPADRVIAEIVRRAIKMNDGDFRDLSLTIDNDSALYNLAAQHAKRAGADMDEGPGAYVEEQAAAYLKELTDQDANTGERIYKALADKAGAEIDTAGQDFADGKPMGRAITEWNANPFKGASALLREAGIPGIKYLDGSSRHDGDGTHNYVLFDDSLAKITQYEQAARGSITFGDNATIIQLFQSRDLSTLAHESGHLWLEELSFDAKNATASDAIKADWQAVLEFVGSTDGYITRDQHELFARGFETYLMEGKAPSEGLRSVFRQFKNWLVSIYRNLTKLQAPLSPEMRQVFDRLIATDEEIANAQNVQALNPVFTDAKSAGMTEAEFAAYTRRATQVVDVAEQAVLEKVMASIRRERTKEVAAEKAKIRGEVTDELMAEPGQAALHLLRTGKLFAGETPEVLVDAKLDRNSLVEILGEAGLANLPAGSYVAEGGVDVDMLATVVGLANGVELVERMMQIQAEQAAMRAKGDNRSVAGARIAEETQRRLTEALGDPLNDGTIEAEAMAAIHSDKQGALMSTELKVLARKAGQTGAITLDDIQSWAESTIAEMSVYQGTQAAKYQRAERMAGQKVQRALIKGDFVAAFKAKQDQLVNFALYQEAKKAAEDVEGIRKLADRYASAATIKSMEQSSLEQIHQLLEDYDFKKRGGKLLAERTTFSAWAAEQAAAGFEVIEPPRLKGATSKHFSQMTVEEIRGVGDTIKQIAHIGRWKQEMLDDGKKRAFEALVDEAVTTAGKIDQRGVSQLRRGTTNLQDALGDTGSWFRSVDSALLKMETMFEWLDNDKTGRGVFSRVVFRRIADAQVVERDMQKDLADRQKAIFDKVPREQSRLWSQQHTVDLPGTKQLNKSQMLAVALNMGNESNKTKLLEGEKWAEADVKAMLDKNLTAEEWRFVQDTWDLIDSKWPETEALEKRVNGVAPPKVEAVAVVTPHGTLRGGYYPMSYDKAGDVKADRVSSKSGEGLFDPEYRRASTRAGSTHERVAGFNAKVLLSLNVIGSHLNEVAHDLAFREAVMDINKFLSNDKVRDAIRGAVGPEYEKQTLVWLKAVANEWAIDRRGLEGIDKFLQTARANTAIVGMGFRVSTMFSQVAGFGNSVQRLGSANMMRGMRDFYRNPFAMAEAVRGKSGEMRHRANDLERDIRLALKRMEGKDSSLDSVRRFAFRGIALFDAAVSLPTWMGAYNDGLRQGMSEADAVHYGDKMVRDTQGAGSVKDLSAFQRGSEPLKLLGMFYSYFNVYYNRQRSIARDFRSADSFSDYMNVVGQGLWLMVIPTLLAGLLSGQGPDDDEEWLTWAMRNVGFGVFSGIPWARDVSGAASNLVGGKNFGGAKLSPIEGIGEGVIKLGKDAVALVQGKETSKTSIKNAFNVTGLFTALPLGQVGASSQFVWDALVEGTQDPEGLLDWMKGLAYGPKHKK